MQNPVLRGCPLITPGGFRLGALAIMDTRPRATFTEEEGASLADLASIVMHELNMQQELATVRASAGTVAEGEAKFHALMESASQAIIAINHKGLIEVVNNKTEELFGYVRDELIGSSIEMLLPEALRGRHANHRRDYFSRPRARPMGIGLDHSKAASIWIETMPCRAERCYASVTDSPLSSTRNESRGAHSLSRFFGVSIPSSASWKVPWWIAILVLAPRISWARTASSGAICTGDINHRGW